MVAKRRESRNLAANTEKKPLIQQLDESASLDDVKAVLNEFLKSQGLESKSTTKRKKRKKVKRNESGDGEQSEIRAPRTRNTVDIIRRKLVPAGLAKKLRAIRRKFELSQAAMLIAVNPFEDSANRARVSQYERGTRVPSLVEVYNYAKYAGIQVEILLDDDKSLPKEYDNY